MRKILVLWLIVFVLAGFCLAQGEELDAKPGTTPGNLFYGLDRALEKVQLAFTRNELKRAELHLKFAEERLAELNELVKNNKTKHVEKLARYQEQEMERAQEGLQKATALGLNTTLLAEHIANMTQKHILVLQRVLEKVPEQARKGILNAINVSIRGGEQAVESITKEKPVEKPSETAETEVPEETEIEEETNKQQGAEEKGKGNLVMKITDKPPVKNNAGEEITKLELTISSIKIHTSGQAVEGTECTETPYIVLKCENETEEEDNCTKINITNEVCINETIVIGQNCTEAECINGTFVEQECINGTLIPESCINLTDIVLNCTNITVENKTCTKINVTTQNCTNVTEYNTTCTNVTGGGSAGWKTVMNTSKTFDLIAIQGVKELLGNISLESGKYTQIRVYISQASVTIGGVKQSLTVPSGALKLINPFTITDGKTTTLTLDFDAGKSVHKAGAKYLMKPTVKIIQE